MAALTPRDPLLVVIGPSGAGKSTVVRAVAAAGLVAVTPTWTTRPARPDELAGCVEHRFVTDREFDALQRLGFFVGTVQAFGLAHRYGLPVVRAPGGGRVPLLMLRASYVPAVRRHYERPIVYQVEDGRDRVEARLLGRHRDPRELGTRLRDYDAEVALGRSVADRVVVNDRDVASLVAAVREAIAADFDGVLLQPARQAPFRITNPAGSRGAPSARR